MSRTSTLATCIAGGLHAGPSALEQTHSAAKTFVGNGILAVLVIIIRATSLFPDVDAPQVQPVLVQMSSSLPRS
eukprot:7999581-Pyramimonas_sp.AAC.1